LPKKLLRSLKNYELQLMQVMAEKIQGQKWVTVAVARTGMVCYNYDQKKIASVPKEVCTRLLS